MSGTGEGRVVNSDMKLLWVSVALGISTVLFTIFVLGPFSFHTLDGLEFGGLILISIVCSVIFFPLVEFCLKNKDLKFLRPLLVGMIIFVLVLRFSIMNSLSEAQYTGLIVGYWVVALLCVKYLAGIDNNTLQVSQKGESPQVKNSFWRILWLSLVTGILTAYMIVGALGFPLGFGMLIVNPIALIFSTGLGIINGGLLSPLAYFCLRDRDTKIVKKLQWGMAIVGVVVGIALSPLVLNRTDGNDIVEVAIIMNIYWIAALLYVKFRVRDHGEPEGS